MTRIGVVFFSAGGRTAQQAQAVQDGVLRGEGASIFSHQIVESDLVGGRFRNDAVFDTLLRCGAVIFGTPTYMGGPAAQFKAFADATARHWSSQDWSGKVAAGFTCGTGWNGDQGVTLQALVTLALQQGMLWVGVDRPYGEDPEGLNRLGCQTGAVARSEAGQLHPADLATAAYLGERVARIAMRLAD